MTQFIEYVKMALYNIKQNKGRSFLTMLGIIIGISAVITIVSIGNGIQEEFVEVASLSSINVTVNPEEVDDPNIITLEDMEALSVALGDSIDGVVSSFMEFGTTETRKGEFDAYITLTTPDAEGDETKKEIILGEYFTDVDMQNASMVVVIDRMSAVYLFGTDDVIGMNMDMQIGGSIVSAMIKGIRDVDQAYAEETEATMEMFGMSMPIMIEMPYTAAQNWGVEYDGFSSVTLYLPNEADENAVAKEAIDVLDVRHGRGEESKFQREAVMDLTMITSVLDAMTAFVAFVASISLLVGGIGVMNIMLVSVTERRREIGIRKALGAKTSSVVTQFLCESAIISGIGGIIGIMIGGGVAQLIEFTGVGGLSASLSIEAILLATGFSCGVGIVFGIYPARKAARMTPIEALRQM